MKHDQVYGSKPFIMNDLRDIRGPPAKLLDREARLCLLQEPDDLRQDGGTISSRYRAITQRLNTDLNNPCQVLLNSCHGPVILALRGSIASIL